MQAYIDGSTKSYIGKGEILGGTDLIVCEYNFDLVDVSGPCL